MVNGLMFLSYNLHFVLIPGTSVKFQISNYKFQLLLNKAIFIDRDGVINSDVGHYYIYRPDDFVINDGILEALKQFQESGYLLIVISNQGGVDKGEYTTDDVEQVHQKMKELLSADGIELTDIYYCPHHNTIQKCLCRKPLNLNIEKAIARFDIDRTQSWMIGDSPRDIVAGKAAGLKTLKLESNENLLPFVDQIL
jgi:D-glycero-D-manno-heptose 1,7-bisphosphate phosphatase